MSDRLVVELPPSVIETIVERVTERVLAELQQRARLLSIEDAARELGMKPEALRKHAARGNVPTVKVGRRVFVDMEALRS